MMCPNLLTFGSLNKNSLTLNGPVSWSPAACISGLSEEKVKEWLFVVVVMPVITGNVLRN